MLASDEILRDWEFGVLIRDYREEGRCLGVLLTDDKDMALSMLLRHDGRSELWVREEDMGG